jgi:hypothetical protein
MLKHTLTAVALAALLTTPALAQQPAPDGMNNKMQSAPYGAMTKPNESQKGDMAAMSAGARQAGFMHRQQANEWRGSELIGAPVYGPDNRSIGDINEVLIDKDGRVTAVVVGVGGFLGVGEKNVALPFRALDVARKDGAIDKIIVAYTRNQLNDAPGFAYYKGGQAETTGMKPDDSGGTAMTRDRSDSKMMPDKQKK